MALVVAPAGMVTCACPSLMTRTTPFRASPTHARFNPVRPEPLMVTTVPTGPEVGEKLSIHGCAYAGAALTTVNSCAVNAVCVGEKMPMCPVVASVGIVTCIWESLSTRTVALCELPTQAWLMPVNPEPLMVTTVPIAPEVGATDVIPMV